MITIPKWFEYNVYMQSKLAQLRKTESSADWTMYKLIGAFGNDDLRAAIADSGTEYTPVVAAYEHFVLYGHNPNENLTPNRWFNPEYYVKARAKKGLAAYSTTSISAWDHYTRNGATEKVSPSMWFNSKAYVEDAHVPSGTNPLVHCILNAGDLLNPISNRVTAFLDPTRRILLPPYNKAEEEVTEWWSEYKTVFKKDMIPIAYPTSELEVEST